MYAVLHIPDFGLQAILRIDPETAGRAVALLDGEHRNAVITACAAAAAGAGVKQGQTPPQALVYCPDLLFRVPNAAAEQEARDALLATAFSVSPSVEQTAPGTCTLEISGVEPARREAALCVAIERLRTLELTATAGMASTPLLALYAARHASRLRTQNPESRIQEASPSSIGPLLLEVAEPAELAPILAGWGIRTLGQLAALPKAGIAHRLGPAGLALWERAAGEAVRPLRLSAPARAFAASFECEHALETLEPLLFILRRFVDRLALELENAGLAAVELMLQLGLADETVHRHAIRLPEPSTSAEVLFRTLYSYLEPLRTAAAVISARLSIAPARIAARQQGLFDGALRDPHGFAETLDRATAIVGSGRVGTPESDNVHRPDAFRMVRPAVSLVSPPADFRHPACGLLLRRFRPPLVATVELGESESERETTGPASGLLPEKAAGGTRDPEAALSLSLRRKPRPTFIWTSAVRGAVRALAGPWHGSGEWWQADRAWQREEWDAELDSGGLYRLIRTPTGWFLEGEYD